jgi:hypothetical protein
MKKDESDCKGGQSRFGDELTGDSAKLKEAILINDLFQKENKLD